MPRRGENIRKRADGRWEGRYIYDRDITGKAKYRSVYAKSYAEAKALLKASSPSSHRPAKSSNDSMYLFGSTAQQWLKQCELSRKHSTVVKYRSMLEKHILPVLEKCPLSAVTEDKVQLFIRHKSTELSPSTLHSILTVIKSIMRYAQRLDRISAPPLEISISSRHRREIEAFSASECERLEAYLVCNMNLMKLGIYLCFYTGLRVGELCALRWKNISFSSRKLSVTSTIQRISSPDKSATRKTVLMITEPKSASSVRDIPLPPQLIALLYSFRSDDNSYILTGTNEPMEPRRVQYWFKKYAKELNLSHSNPHALRHTFATRCIELGFDAKTLSELLGHSKVEITLNKYVHSSDERKRAQMELLFANTGQNPGQTTVKSALPSQNHPSMQ